MGSIWIFPFPDFPRSFLFLISSLSSAIPALLSASVLALFSAAAGAGAAGAAGERVSLLWGGRSEQRKIKPKARYHDGASRQDSDRAKATAHQPTNTTNQ